jgi:uncharacterized protein (TIGR00369 family)
LVTYINDPSYGRNIAQYVGVGIREVGDHTAGVIEVVGEVDVTPVLCGDDGRLLHGALLTLCDNVGGFCGGLASLPDGWVVTTNLMLRSRAGLGAGSLRLESDVLRKGRRSVVTGVRVIDRSGAVVGDATVTSAVLVPDGGAPHWDRPASTGVPQPPEPGSRFYQWLGMRRVDDSRADAAVELEVRDAVRNPWGIVHGGVSASLVDAAATALAPGQSTDVVVHYLAPIRIGPARALATRIGRRPDGLVVRVIVRDEGADRDCVLAVATVR